MSFSADWLSLRRAADLRARDAGLTRALAAALVGRGPGQLRVLDLGAGSGANMAALAPCIAADQIWRLADNDPALLYRAVPPRDVTVEHWHVDLSGDLAALFDPAPDLVTASAFFDLCGVAIADRLVAHAARSGAVVHAVLTYDGREIWSPPHPLDAAVLSAFHTDQRRDKGLGPALGPAAAGHLADALRAAGYRVATGRSDWLLNAPDDDALIVALAEGSARAVAPVLGERASLWREARKHARAVTIGHLDLLALPPD